MTFVDWLMSPQAGTVLIGLVAAGIAWQNLRTTRNKLKFDMFEKRLQTYRGIKDLLTEARNAGWCSRPLLDSYEQLQAQARFLFSNEAIDSHLDETGDQLRGLISMEWHEPGSMEDETEQLDRRGAVVWWYGHAGFAGSEEATGVLVKDNPWLRHVIWLESQKNRLDDLTLPYLRLSH